MIAEDESFRVYLMENGYDVTLLGMHSDAGSLEGGVGETIPSEEDIKPPVAENSSS